MSIEGIRTAKVDGFRRLRADDAGVTLRLPAAAAWCGPALVALGLFFVLFGGADSELGPVDARIGLSAPEAFSPLGQTFGRWRFDLRGQDPNVGMDVTVLLAHAADLSTGTLPVEIVYSADLERDADLRAGVEAATALWRDQIYGPAGLDVTFTERDWDGPARLASPGYGDADWSHGDWRGADWSQRFDVDLTDPAVAPRIPFGNIDHVARAVCRGPEGEAEGFGLFEHATIGRHDPTGFADIMSVAP